MSLYTEPFSVILSVAGPRQDGSEVTPATLATLAASEVPIPIAFGRATVGEIERLELEERGGEGVRGRLRPLPRRRGQVGALGDQGSDVSARMSFTRPPPRRHGRRW